MEAIVVREYGDESVLKLEDIDKPAPGAGEVLVEVKAAGVNPVDTYVRQGNHISAPPVPFTPGKDGAGVVAEVGEGVTKVSVGDRVYLAGSISGTYAEYALCTEDQVYHLPDNTSFEQGAGIFVPYATAYRALFKKARVKAGESVLIHGASGAVGIAAIQWARNAGLEVHGTASTNEGMDLILKCGSASAHDHGGEGYMEGIRVASGGGVDVILEMLANVNLVNDFEVLKKWGRIVVIGSRGPIEFDPRLTMTNEATIAGMSLFNATSEEFEEIHSAIQKGLAEWYLSPVVNRTFPLVDASKAHYEVINSKAFGKIVLKP